MKQVVGIALVITFENNDIIFSFIRIDILTIISARIILEEVRAVGNETC